MTNVQNDEVLAYTHNDFHAEGTKMAFHCKTVPNSALKDANGERPERENHDDLDSFWILLIMYHKTYSVTGLYLRTEVLCHKSHCIPMLD